MIRVVTVHWQDPRWIAPQQRHLQHNLGAHAVYAALNGIDPAYGRDLHFAEDLPGKHPEKLNALAEIAADEAAPDDLLLFLDGDAFPIAPVDESVLGGTPLAAVRRDENGGDRQPHPSFCLTTVGFWRDIGGDWRRGHQWQATNGDWVTDVGGNLLGLLEARGIPWRPLLRSNRVDLHPLWFGIYGDVAYHHGAGFRDPLSRRDELQSVTERRRRVGSRTLVPARVPIAARVERSLRYRLAERRRRHELAADVEAGRRLSEEVFRWVVDDPDFHLRFLEPSAAS